MSRFASLTTLRRATLHLRKRRAARGVILMYHRVAEPTVDPWLLSVTPEHFAQHLRVLQKHARPISLRQLRAAQRDGSMPDRIAVVTFDDGYANNLHVAKPILERHGVPATVFVTMGYIGKPHEFWWDELDQLLLEPRLLPPRLRLSLGDTVQRWDLDSAVHAHHERDGVASNARSGSRQAFYQAVWQALRPLSEDGRRAALDQIRDWCGVTPLVRPSHRPMTADEVVQLAAGGLVEIGAHTVTHPLLTSVAPAIQRREIQESKAALEEVLGRPVTSFCYPFGARAPATVALVREAGFDCACSVSSETVWRYSDPFQLPRFEVQDWSGEEFEGRLTRWFRQHVAPR